MKDISVSVKLLNNGFIILVGNRKYQHLYPENIWYNFPQQFKSILSESAAVLFTRHFIFLKNCRIIYNFPPPVIDSLFFHGLLFSLPETVIEFSEFKHQTSGLIKTLFNRQQQIEFSGFPKSYSVTPLTNLHRNAVIPFTFGKDSLLTLGLIRELKIKPLLFFGAEPLSRYENEMRQKMIPQFEKAVGIKVNYWPITIGRLRQKGREMWGWDMLQLQYTLLLLPYIYFNQAKYLFYANEQNTNDYEVDKEGYKVNLYFEQSREWMLHANNLLRIFALPTLLGSLVEPVYELLVTYILHHRYQSLAQFQISCCGDAPQAKTDRWCGECFECGRMYIFLLAIGVDPLKLGFKRNLLKSRKKDLFDIFSKKNPPYSDTLY